jgi:integrase
MGYEPAPALASIISLRSSLSRRRRRAGPHPLSGILCRPPSTTRTSVAPTVASWRTSSVSTAIGNHSFRATGITAYLKNGGTLEKAAAMANHSSTLTTQLYDRRRDEMSLEELGRPADFWQHAESQKYFGDALACSSL